MTNIKSDIKKMLNDEVIQVDEHINLYNKIIKKIGESIVNNSKQIYQNESKINELDKEIKRLDELINEKENSNDIDLDYLIDELPKLKYKKGELEDEYNICILNILDEENDEYGDTKTEIEKYKSTLSIYKNQIKSLIELIEDQEEDGSYSKEDIHNQILNLNKYYIDNIVSKFIEDDDEQYGDDIDRILHQIKNNKNKEQLNEDTNEWKIRTFKTKIIIQ